MQSVSSTNPESSRVCDRPEPRWNAENRTENPFADHRFLSALEACECIGPETGWTSTVIETASGESFAPTWLKHHSHGEFVFDFAWAQAAHHAGLDWYPKLLVAVPLTPVTGPRLLGGSSGTRRELIGCFEERVERDGLSSCAVNFCDRTDRAELESSDWLARSDWQFHWFNHDYRDFDAFLGTMRSKPRKNIRRERRMAHEDGWSYRWVDGTEIRDSELDTVHACYRTTFLRYRNLPALTREFFERVARSFGTQFLVCFASQHGQDLACGVFWRNRETLFGRYWGSLVETRDVHFETCYYQGIEYCIENELARFEPGAQGEHKIRRGFLPVRTWSYHYIRHRGLREGIRRWLEMEHAALEDYRRQLRDLEPFRDEDDFRES